MFEQLERSWAMVRTSASVFALHKKLLLLPLASFVLVAGLALLYRPFILALRSVDGVRTILDAPDTKMFVIFAIAFTLYFVCVSIFTFFNAALTYCALQFFAHEQPSLGEGLAHALRRLPQILAWALLAASVGALLRALKIRFAGGAGRLVGFVFGLAEIGWMAATYFVLPIIVVEKAGPVDAVKQSSTVIRSTWGDAAGGEAGLGLIGLLISLPVMFLPTLWGFKILSEGGLILPLIVFLGGYLLLTMCLISAVGVVFRTGAYVFAQTGEAPRAVEPEIFNVVMRAGASPPEFFQFVGRRRSVQPADYGLAVLCTAGCIGAFAFIAMSPVLLCKGGGSGGNCGEGLMASLPLAGLLLPVIIFAGRKFYTSMR